MGGVIALRMTERRDLLVAASNGQGERNRAQWLLSKIRAVFNMSPPR
ncbi:MAG: hypothetical protein ABSC63_19455 [Candidatus Binataceae bacterium]|jgi:hypothetical protein